MTDPDDRDLDVFLTAYADDDNEWWRSSSGAHQVWFDQLVDRYEHLAAQLAAARTNLTEFVENPPYAAQMYDDLRCVYCATIIVGNKHTPACLVSRAHDWLAGSIEPSGNR